MTVPAIDLRKMSDDEIWDHLHLGEVDSPLHRQCVLMLQMRNAERQTKASAEMVQATKDLAQFTRGLVCATWVLAGISIALALIAAAQLYLTWKGSADRCHLREKTYRTNER